ncbi:hypothetical protein J4212_00345 [Candidatus Woesearchaeota archaeon]|nr:hypothetical protein [Candidatus Woesearchaeota archaeon]
MDADDLEIWYDDEKQKIADKYSDDLGNSKKPKELENKFHAEMEKLMKRYNERMQKILLKEKKSRERKAKIALAKKKLLAKLEPVLGRLMKKEDDSK